MSEYYYVEIDSETKVVLVKKGATSQPFIPDLSAINRECIDVTSFADQDLPEEGDIYDPDTNTFSTPTMTEKVYREGTAWDFKRRDNYPSINEQLDMLYHDKVNGTNTWKEKIQEVKDAFPKQTFNEETGEYE
jgi:hypothetical protein